MSPGKKLLVTAAAPPAAEVRPAAVLDVDGVLNRYLLDGEEPGWKRYIVSLGNGTFACYFNQEQGLALLRFADQTGAELVWGTRWEQDANEIASPILGLPVLPVAPVPHTFSYSPKAMGIIPWLGKRPFVWFEDEPEEKMAADTIAVQPHLVVLVDPAEGLAQRHLDEAASWLADLAAGKLRS